MSVEKSAAEVWVIGGPATLLVVELETSRVLDRVSALPLVALSVPYKNNGIEGLGLAGICEASGVDDVDGFCEEALPFTCSLFPVFFVVAILSRSIVIKNM